MGRNELLAIIARERPTEPDRHHMIAALCPDWFLVSASPDEVAAKVRSVTFLYWASSSEDDDTYWGARSPFDNKWYLFASGLGGGMPRTPVRVSSDRPSVFDD